VAATSDTNTGLRWDGSTFVSLVSQGADVVRAFTAQLQAVLGLVGAPVYSFIGDEDTGAWSPGANRYAISTAGNQAFEIDAAGQMDLALQFRGVARRAAVQNVGTSGTLSNVSWDTQDEDIGAAFAPTSADITIPTDGTGRYGVTLTITFDESSSTSPNVNDRGVAIEANGVTLSPHSHPARVAGDTEISTYCEFDITAGQIIRGQAFQDSGGAMDVTGRITWRKVA